MAEPTPDPIGLRWTASPRRAMASAAGVAIVATGCVLALNGTSALGWHAATRATAMLAFPLWLLSFTAAPLARLTPGSVTRVLRARRRALGLAFATAQTIHGVAILALARLEPEVLTPNLSSIGGGAGFALIFAMAATSNDAAVRRLGTARWRRLHGFGQIYLAVVYAVTYGGRVAEDTAFWPGLAILLAAIGLRVAARAQSLRLRSSTLPTE